MGFANIVFNSVDLAVGWGLAHRDLSNIKSIGVEDVCADNGQLNRLLIL